MTKTVPILCTLLALTALPPSFSQTPTQQQPVTREELTRLIERRTARVNQLWSQKNYKEAITILEELNALPNLSEIEGAQSGVLYNLACAYSLLGQTEKALSSLEGAVGAGYSDLNHIGQDTDLDNIRNEARFKSVCEKLKRGADFWDNPLFSTSYRPDISREEKIAGLSKFWSEVKYNFVFVDRLGELNWDSLYLAYIPLVEQTTSTAAYYRLLSKLCALLQDGHTSVSPPPEIWNEQFAVPPITTWIVNDTVVVLWAADSLKSRGIDRGLQIVAIDGLPVHEYAERNVIPYVPSSTQQYMLTRAYGYLLLAGPERTSVQIEFRDSTGATFSRSVLRPEKPKAAVPSDAVKAKPAPSRPPLQFKVLPGNFGYVSLDSFNDPSVVAGFDSLFPAIENTDALILDVRTNGGGNSGYGWQILSYLTDKPFATSEWRTREYRPAYRAWGRGAQWYSERGQDYQPNGSKLYTKPVVVLAGPITFSAAEDFCVAFDYMHRGTIIGARTGGSTGQPLLFQLPGGGSARVCTKHDRYPDGREFVGTGVLPGIEVTRTVDDLLKGRDRVLDAAVQFLRTKIR